MSRHKNKESLIKMAEQKAQEYTKEREKTEEKSQASPFPTNYEGLIYGVGGNQGSVPLDELVEADPDWNFFRPMPQDKFQALMESIEDQGLIHPILVWEQPNGSYMILSGHNRYKAFKTLHQITGDKNYYRIPAIIKKYNELNEMSARQLIIDTNYLQRELNEAEKIQSIVFRYNELVNYKKEEHKESRLHNQITSVEELAESFGMTRRSIYYYASLQNLIPSLAKLLSQQEIKLTAAIAFSKLSQEQQQELYLTYQHYFNKNSSMLKGIKANMNYEKIKSSIDNKISERSNPLKKIIFHVPPEYEHEIKDIVREYLDEKQTKTVQNRNS